MKRMKPESMQRVHQIFLGLKPITIHRTANPRSHSRLELATSPFPYVVDWKLRQLVRRPHVRKDQTAELAHRITGMLDLVKERIGSGLQRHFENVAFNVV